MEFKLTAEGNVIEQLHSRKRSTLVSMHQTTKCLFFPFKGSKQINQVVLLEPLIEITMQGYQFAIMVNNSIIDYINHLDLLQTYPINVPSIDARYTPNTVYLTKECFSSLSYFSKIIHLLPFGKLLSSIILDMTMLVTLNGMAMIDDKAKPVKLQMKIKKLLGKYG
jgi:hypothetical protein